eukprot:m.29924 g.29924  ORF g.29924 m.29924 type:complete len:209 (-) comp40794_c0_seq2:27-653(-)
MASSSTIPASEASAAPQTHSKTQQAKQSVDSKKAPMRTASDVIGRIRWDESIDRTRVIVGYIDRFVGIIEKTFNEFNWTDDLAALSHRAVAIPTHRIVYFKYVDTPIWDKRTRLDCVFGSTGGIRFQQLLEQHAQQAPAIELVLEAQEDEEAEDDDVEVDTAADAAAQADDAEPIAAEPLPQRAPRIRRAHAPEPTDAAATTTDAADN